MAAEALRQRRDRPAGAARPRRSGSQGTTGVSTDAGRAASGEVAIPRPPEAPAPTESESATEAEDAAAIASRGAPERPTSSSRGRRRARGDAEADQAIAEATVAERADADDGRSDAGGAPTAPTTETTES